MTPLTHKSANFQSMLSSLPLISSVSVVRHGYPTQISLITQYLVGPSSSHTVGPMRAGKIFIADLADLKLLEEVCNSP
jgi:hypothetical protein